MYPIRLSLFVLAGCLLGNGRLAAQNDTLQYLSDGIYFKETGGKKKWGFYRPGSRDTIGKPEYDSLYYRFWHGTDVAYYKLMREGKWGIYDRNRNPIMPIQYDEVYYNHQAQPARIEARLGDKWGVFSTQGQALIPIAFDEIQSDGFSYKVRKGDKLGVYNADGGVEIPACYDDIFDHRFTERSLVRLGKQWSVYRWLRQNETDPCQPATLYDGVGYFLDYFMVQKQGKCGLLDLDAKPILPLEYEKISVFYEAYLRTLLVKQNGKLGLLRIDSANKIHTEVPIEYDDIWVEHETLKLKVKKGDRIDYFYGDAPYFGLEYNDVHYFDRIRMFTLKKKGKWGLALEDKRLMIKPMYDKITIFDKNNFWVQKGGKWGLVDVYGKVKIPLQYVGYEYLEEWQIFFVAKSATQFGIASPRVGVLLDAQYEDIIILTPKMYLVQKKGLWGIMGPNGRVWADIIYTTFEWKAGSDKIWLIDNMNKKVPIKIVQ